MPLSSTKRALLAVAVVAGLCAIAAAVYVYRHHRPLRGASAGAAPELLSQLPSDAPAIGYVNVAALRELRNSPLAAVLGLTSPGPAADREYAEFVRETGFDYTRDLDRVALAAWPQSFAAPQGGIGDNRVLAIADGRFDEKKIQAYALRTGKMALRGLQSYYIVPGIPPVSLAFLSLGRIAVASGKDADRLVAVHESSTRDAVMEARIARVAGAPLFAVARTDHLPASFYANFSNSPQLERLVRSVRGLSLAGQPDADNIKLALDAECDSMSNALQLATLLDILRMSSTIALADPKTRRQMTKPQAALLDSLVHRLKITHQDVWVRLTLDVTPEMLGTSLREPSAVLLWPNSSR